MYVSFKLLPVVEACVVVAVPGRVGEVRVAADEPEAVDLDPGALARRLDAPATVEAVLDSDTGFSTVKRVSEAAVIGFRDGPVHFNHAAVESALLLRITSAPSGLPGDGGRRHGAG